LLRLTAKGYPDFKSLPGWVKILLCLVMLPSLFLSGCERTNPRGLLDEIIQDGEITMITRNDADCYYSYRNKPMGFEYDLAKAFAEYLGVRLKVRTADTWKSMQTALHKNEAAFIAANIPISDQSSKEILFSNGYLEIQQHLITHRDNSWAGGLDDLGGNNIHVSIGSIYHDHLKSLKRQGYDLKIKLHINAQAEELIRQVAAGKLESTVAPTNVALRIRRHYHQVMISEPISPAFFLGWAVKKDSRKLLNQINSFFSEIQKNGVFDKIYERYYADLEPLDYMDLSMFHFRMKTRFAPFKKIVQRAAEKNNLDWRLIAAQMYQESQFDPGAQSDAGAFGLMQLTSSTAESLKIGNVLNPEQNIAAGVRYLRRLYDHFSGIPEEDRLFTALAAYNAGIGHILDARNLARKLKLSPDKWTSMVEVLPLLQQRAYYKHTRHGYCRGSETVKYIEQISAYYDILKHKDIEYVSQLSDSPLPEA
jgi:membrane-bound lytic murein transglycosylase F